MSKFVPVDVNALKNTPLPSQPIANGRDLPTDVRDQLLAVDGVNGYGFSNEEVVVYISASTDVSRIPTELDGLSVRTEVTGSIGATGA